MSKKSEFSSRQSSRAPVRIYILLEKKKKTILKKILWTSKWEKVSLAMVNWVVLDVASENGDLD